MPRVRAPTQDKWAPPERPSEADFVMLKASPVVGSDPDTQLTLRDYQVVGLNWLLFNW